MVSNCVALYSRASTISRGEWRRALSERDASGLHFASCRPACAWFAAKSFAPPALWYAPFKHCMPSCGLVHITHRLGSLVFCCCQGSRFGTVQATVCQLDGVARRMACQRKATEDSPFSVVVVRIPPQTLYPNGCFNSNNRSDSRQLLSDSWCCSRAW